MNEHIDYLHTLDGEIEGLSSDLAYVDLTWAHYVITHKLNVKAFFTAAKADKSYTWHRTVGTWESTTSNARKVLDHFAAMTFDEVTYRDDADVLARAWQNWNAWNDERVANGERPSWSIQLIAKSLQPAKAKAGKAEAGKAEAESTADAADADKTPVIDVIMSLLPSLDAADLATLAAAVAQRQTLVAVA